MARYLVIQLARFGDLMQTKRLLCGLAAMDNAEVHLCVDRSLEGIARLVYPGLRVHTLAAHATGSGLDAPTLLQNNRRCFEALTAIEPDAVFNLNFSGLNFALASLFDPTRVRGYQMKDGQALKDGWADLAFRWTRRRATSPLNLVDYWAGFGPKLFPADAVNPSPQTDGRGLGVVLAGRNSRRSLPAEVLAPVARAALRTCDTAKVFLLGGKEDVPLARAFMRRADTELRGCVRDLTGATDWRQLVETVSSLELLLTPDTGVMHLAAHLGTRTLAFFLASAWVWETGPYGQGHRVCQSVTDCAPCVESQPCGCGLACLEPFRSREFLRAVTQNDASAAVDGLVILESEFDALGVIYRGQNSTTTYDAERTGLRRLVAAHLGVDSLQDPAAPAVPGHALYHERDWMLPHEKPPTLDLA